jgi:hypothetical protein
MQGFGAGLQAYARNKMMADEARRQQMMAPLQRALMEAKTNYYEQGGLTRGVGKLPGWLAKLPGWLAAMKGKLSKEEYDELERAYATKQTTMAGSIPDPFTQMATAFAFATNQDIPEELRKPWMKVYEKLRDASGTPTVPSPTPPPAVPPRPAPSPRPPAPVAPPPQAPITPPQAPPTALPRPRSPLEGKIGNADQQQYVASLEVAKALLKLPSEKRKKLTASIQKAREAGATWDAILGTEDIQKLIGNRQ